MIGDVNLFLKGSPEDDDDELEVEVEIMIAGESPAAPHPHKDDPQSLLILRRTNVTIITAATRDP